MTAKRFAVDYFIKDYHSHIIDCNEEIKTLEEYADYLNKLEKENEQLKQFKEKVFAKIDMYLQLLPRLRNENESDESGLYHGAILTLETLKKELEE